MKNVSSNMKMRVIGAIDISEGSTIRERIKSVAKLSHEDEEGISHRFTWRTISTWYYRYKTHGVTVMNPKTRSDKGSRRKIAPEQVQEAIDQVFPQFRNKHVSKAQVYKTCIEKGLLRREQIAPNTFNRIVNQYEMFKPDAEVKNKKRLAFSKRYANQMWQGDTMFGPFLSNGKKKVQTKLICFIDDASRVICHGEFFFNENVDTLITTLRAAFYKRGIPEQIYVDNGSIYTSKEIICITARLGCILSHTPVRDGAAKGKIERFFRTVRECFLIRNLDLSSLQRLNQQFNRWVEEEYNSRVHSTIGMKPIDRFGIDLSRIRFLPPNENNDEMFYVEENRNVKKDNTFQLKSIIFEAPRNLSDKKIQVRFDRFNFDKVIVFYKGDRMGIARPLDRITNDRAPIACEGGIR